MKIAIVEDEPRIRDGLQNMICKNTEHVIVGIAENGREGFSMIKNCRPDLVITDIRMPEKSGLTMLAELKADGLDVNSIILSGYSDFQYAQNAIKIGVAEYLLKPVTWDDLKKSLVTIEKKINLTKSLRPSLEQLFWMILSEKSENKQQAIENISQLVGINSSSQYALFLVKPTNIVMETYLEIMNAIRDKMEMLCIENYKIVRLPMQFGILVFVTDTEKMVFLESNFSEYILPRICKINSCSCSSGRFCIISSLDEQLNYLKHQLLFSLAYSVPVLINDDLIHSAQFGKMEYPTKLELSMKQSICNGNTVDIRRIADEFTNTVFRIPCNPESVLDYFTRFLFGISATICECDPGSSGRMVNNELIKKIGMVTTREELLSIYDEAIDSISTKDVEQRPTQNIIILKVIAYIRKNYKSDITLGQMADLVDVTPEYLSSLFSKEMNINFSSFLKNYRISCAKRLILCDKYKVQEIAREVGFNDPKYFNRVFKEVCGVSPSEFKNSVE